MTKSKARMIVCIAHIGSIWAALMLALLAGCFSLPWIAAACAVTAAMLTIFGGFFLYLSGYAEPDNADIIAGWIVALNRGGNQ